jgi:hypothetical protein
MRELDDSGLVRPTTVGYWRGKRATEWRLTFHRCDSTGDLPNKSWPAHSQSDQKDSSQSDHEDSKVRPEGQIPTLSPTTGTHRAKNPINRNALSPTSGTHIDIYQGVPALDTRAPVTDQPALDPPECIENNFGPSGADETDPRLAALLRTENRKKSAIKET